MSRSKNIRHEKRMPDRLAAHKKRKTVIEDLDIEDLDMEETEPEDTDENTDTESTDTEEDTPKEGVLENEPDEDSKGSKDLEEDADLEEPEEGDGTLKELDAEDEDLEELDVNDEDLEELEEEDDPEEENDKHGSVNGKKTSASPSPKKANFHLNLHLVLIAAIFLIAVIAVYRLYRWNLGTPIDTDAEDDIDPSQFDVETLDMIIPMDASLLEGREDDGETTILCLGNNPFSDDRSDTGLASLIAEKTNSTVYDCSFPDSSAACKNPTYSPDYTRDHFNFYYVVECFRNDEFSAITTIASQESDPRYTEAADVMKTVDMDKVDIIIIMYDSTDYNIGTASDNPNNPYDVTAFTGGLRTTIENIKNTWPYIRIFVMSHTYAQHLDEDGKLHNGTITDLGNGTLNHYLVKESEAIMDCGVSFIDNYYGTINEDNFEEYMTDYMHYNDAGREKLADRIADIINNRMETVNSIK